MLDQDYKLLHTLAVLSNVYNAVSSWYNNTGERIHAITDHDRRILGALLQAGIDFNA